MRCRKHAERHRVIRQPSRSLTPLWPRSSIRTLWDAKFDDPADVAAISWAEWRPHAGPSLWGVLVSFHGRSQHDEIAQGIQIVSGLPIILFTVPEHAPKFDGKVLDHAHERSFFLRDP